MQHATPAKLRDGSWGARTNGTVRAGDIVQITTRAGKTWAATVTRVVWSGDGVTLCATASAPQHTTSSRQPASQPARRRYVPRDHEDCLSFGSCGPSCDYAWIGR